MCLAKPIISRHIIKMKTTAHDLIKVSAAGASDAFSVQQHHWNALLACSQPDTYLSRLAAHMYLHASMFWGNLLVDFSPFNWMSSVGRKVQKIKCFPERRVGRDSRPCLGETSSRRRLRLWATHCRPDCRPFITGTLCVSPLTHEQHSPWLTHTHTHTQPHTHPSTDCF